MRLATPPPPAELQAKLRLGRFFTWCCYLGLLAVLLVGLFKFHLPTTSSFFVVLTVLWLPLLLFLPALLQRNPRGHVWLCFVSLVYFMQGTTTFIVPGKAGLGALQAGLALGLFTAAMLYGRWRSMELRTAS